MLSTVFSYELKAQNRMFQNRSECFSGDIVNVLHDAVFNSAKFAIGPQYTTNFRTLADAKDCQDMDVLEKNMPAEEFRELA
ncbi:hypothetical protein AVEN_4351-1 [Araneus ventricosus]|uniref:Uncharacterized protein n=1 Tax=Araneus ventricosus TaxID=182803 RepID=A0A4Y2PEV3_ARAVE|nr:hypothetical protein AVEN_4351-1 [Araneus ventricosus]